MVTGGCEPCLNFAESAPFPDRSRPRAPHRPTRGMDYAGWWIVSHVCHVASNLSPVAVPRLCARLPRLLYFCTRTAETCAQPCSSQNADMLKPSMPNHDGTGLSSPTDRGQSLATRRRRSRRKEFVVPASAHGVTQAFVRLFDATEDGIRFVFIVGVLVRVPFP